MLTLLGSLLGFFGSVVPEFFRLHQDKQDKKHELQILNFQLEQQKNINSEHLIAINTQADIAESASIYKTFYSGNASTDKLNAIVRPIIALGFFTLYCVIKVFAYFYIPNLDQAPYIVIYQTLWNQEDAAVFAGIISFYFGNRSLCKFRNRS